jgi:hypothetical protein
VAVAVERLKREPVAWLRNYQGDEPLEKLEDAWLKGESEWTLFSAGHFFEIKVVGGRVVQRSAPIGDRLASLEIQWRLEYEARQESVRPGRVARLRSARLAAGAAGLGPPARVDLDDFSPVAIPESVRGEILRKTDTENFPLLLESCRIAVIGQATTGMPVAWNSFGPVDRRQDPEGWASASRALMALLAEAEDFRRIHFEDAGKAAPP